MKNFKKFIATILATTLAFGCIGSMSTFGSASTDNFMIEEHDERRDFFRKYDKMDCFVDDENPLKFEDFLNANDKKAYLAQLYSCYKELIIVPEYDDYARIIALWKNLNNFIKCSLNSEDFFTINQKGEYCVCFSVLVLINSYINQYGFDIFKDMDMDIEKICNFKRRIEKSIRSFFLKVNKNIMYWSF